MKLLQNKISDNRFLRLIDVLITAPIMEGKQETKNTCGCPKGSILSSILANIYLHYVIDEWFVSIKQTHIKGQAELIRFADDMVFVFQRQNEAERFYNVLPKRLAKGDLELHEKKLHLIPAGRIAASKASEQDARLPSFNFLGFTCYWGQAQNGFWRLKFTSRKDRFAAKLQRLKEYLRKNLNTNDTPGIIESVI